MSRRKRETDLVSLLQLPWQLMALFAIGGFVLFYWIAPASLKGVAAIMFTSFFRVLGWAALVVLGLISLAAYLKQRQTGGAVAGSWSAARGLSGSGVERSSGNVHGSSAAASDRRIEPKGFNALDEARDTQLRASLSMRGSATSEMEPAPATWSLQVLRRMEWKRFELLAAAYYEKIGFRAETIRCGADGGIDAKLFRGDLPNPVSILQCKAWNSRPVGVKPVRELLGVMTHNKVQTGVFLTTAQFTDEAVAFAKNNKIALVDGEQFLQKILALPSEAQSDLLTTATEGDWTTPSCPSCGVKMVAREGKEKPFWGCPNFPRCRQTFAWSGR